MIRASLYAAATRLELGENKGRDKEETHPQPNVSRKVQSPSRGLTRLARRQPACTAASLGTSGGAAARRRHACRWPYAAMFHVDAESQRLGETLSERFAQRFSAAFPLIHFAARS